MRTPKWAAPVLAVLGLAVLSPLIGEYLLGNISIRELAALPFLMPMYGGGALLIREVARRTGRGWAAILTLGLAYGVIEPGVFDGSLFSASYEGMDYAAARIPVLDVSAFYGLQFVVNHAIWSITIPILLTEACAPRLRAVPWLSRIGLAVTAVAYVLGGLLIRSSGIDDGEYHTTGARAAGVILVALVLVIAAFLLPRPEPARSDGWVPGAWPAGVFAFLATGGYFVMPAGWPGVVAEVILITAAALLIARLARRAGWHARHRIALATGAMMTYAWAGFLLTTLKHGGDPVAFAGNGLLAAVALALALTAIRAGCRAGVVAAPVAVGRGRTGGSGGGGGRSRVAVRDCRRRGSVWVRETAIGRGLPSPSGREGGNVSSSGEPRMVHSGPSGAVELGERLRAAVAEMAGWMGEFGGFDPHPSLDVEAAALDRATGELRARLRENYPFFHPRYAGQMLKPPHPAAVLGYVTAMLVNPNNHALDGGPATARMEKEVIAQLAGMVGFDRHLGHLTSSGTIANLEALFVARQTHPGRTVAYSADAHYTHSRMCQVLGVDGHAVPTVADGTMDLRALEALLRGGRIGTVVATAGTTGLGAVDPVHEIVALCRRYEVRVHVDAAYGGFFRLIADDSPDGVAAAPFAAIAECDSVVIDPHKHGLQPYGCGAVLFNDPGVARHFLHDSPYTYFTSDELHLGEISLECSRAGAAAAALWLTLRLLPLTPDGLGAALRPGRRAALAWARRIAADDRLSLYQPPQLDILTYFPARDRLSQVDEASAGVLTRGMSLPPAEALFVATYTVDAAALAARGHQVVPDVPHGRILRSVLMKPESEQHVPALHQQVLDLLAQGPG